MWARVELLLATLKGAAGAMTQNAVNVSKFFAPDERSDIFISMSALGCLLFQDARHSRLIVVHVGQYLKSIIIVYVFPPGF